MDFNLDKAIRKVPNFPKAGILFYDITSVLSNLEAFGFIESRMIDLYRHKPIDKIIAIDSRGFLFAPLLAKALKIPMVLARKKGKLPNETYQAQYDLEYGKDIIEIQKLDLNKGEKVLIVDDLIATGGTITAIKSIVDKAEANISDIFCVIGLPFLNYKQKLPGITINTLIEYHSE